jgi:hypothetical protein
MILQGKEQPAPVPVSSGTNTDKPAETPLPL